MSEPIEFTPCIALLLANTSVDLKVQSASFEEMVAGERSQVSE